MAEKPAWARFALPTLRSSRHSHPRPVPLCHQRLTVELAALALGQAIAHLHDAPPATDARLNATIAANVAAILAGAHIVRVHDVLAASEAAAIADRILALL